MGPPKKHLSMLRSYTLADLFTLGNAICGTISIFLCLNYLAEGRNQFFWIAFLLLFAALGCDILDGYWSRKSGRHSVLGADLDSLSDVVSFGVAPAVLGFTLGLRGAWDIVILAYFVVCGISRLARFNVTAAALRARGLTAIVDKGRPAGAAPGDSPAPHERTSPALGIMRHGR